MELTTRLLLFDRRRVPTLGLLLYLGRPNLEAADVPLGDDTEIGDDTIIRWKFLLPADADIRAATGWVSGTGNIFYDAAGDPVDVFASEIAVWADINRYNVLFHLVSAGTETGRLAIYALDAAHTTLNKARRVLREDQYDYWAPLGAILHYDAEVAPLSELVGGVHTLNHAVLGPQYQRLADGSYVDVGNQPAVDELPGGINGLRTCGAVTNLIPNSEAVGGNVGVVPTGWYTSIGLANGINRSVIAAVDGSVAYRFWGTPTVTYQTLYPMSPVGGAVAAAGESITSGVTMSCSIVVGTISGYLRIKGWSSDNVQKEYADSAASPIINGVSVNIDKTILLSNALTTKVTTGLEFSFAVGVPVDFTVTVSRFNLTKTAYPQPYVPTAGTSVTQPASNATATNGTWFALPDGSELWQALTGSPFTLATRILMGVGSADLPIGGYQLVGTQTNLNLQYYANANIIAKSFDGVTSAQAILAWLRNATIQRFTQVNTAGTHFRVGYMIEGTHTTIQWSHPSEDSTTWAVFDGSFNPSTLYRFMLGYNNPYPMWFNKITAWKRQVPTTELEAWA